MMKLSNLDVIRRYYGTASDQNDQADSSADQQTVRSETDDYTVPNPTSSSTAPDPLPLPYQPVVGALAGRGIDLGLSGPGAPSFAAPDASDALDPQSDPGGSLTSPETVTLAGSALTFVNTYGAGVTAAYRTAIIYAENELQSHFSNPVTITASFDFGNANGFLAENFFHNTVQASYANLRTALQQHETTANDIAAVNSLPSADPSGGNGFLVTGGMARLLGLPGATTSSSPDLDLILGNGFTWNFDPNNRAAGGYDAIGAIEHELSEGGMGRVGGLGYQNSNWGPMDLFRYSSAGQRDYTGGKDGLTTYFSADGSTLATDHPYHNSVNAAGQFDKADPADWDVGGDAFGFGSPGVPGLLSSVDLTVLDVLGWTPVVAGSVSIGNASVTEGDSGTQTATFTVTRTGGTAAFSVNYATADGTATTADSDYIAKSGTLNFAAGINTQTISVTVDGDTKVEPNETFSVNLSSPTNGATISNATGTGTILNDDTSGSISIGNASVTEGNAGTTTATFTVTRTGGTAPFSVNYATADGSGTIADNDYVARSGTLNFAAGINTQTISVTVNGDTKFEPDETFSVKLSGATNGATITNAAGIGTILNDDAPSAPEIAVSGNGVNIVDGDTTPSTSDGTNFGTVAQGAIDDRVFTVSNTGTSALTTSALTLPSGFTLIEGLSASIAAGSSDTFTVRMDTSSPGTHSGQISFADNDSDENPFNFSITGTVTQNRPPIANSDTYGFATSFTVDAAHGVLHNDSDPDNDPLTAVLATGASHGTVSLNPDGSFTYTANPGYGGAGGDGFTYQANDGHGNLSSPAQVFILPTVVHNGPPFATNDSYSTAENMPLTVSAPGVLANDGDVTGGSVTAVLASNPSHGSLLLNWDGSFTYAPNSGYVGGDSFTYWSSDGEFNSPSPAMVSISVTPPVTAQVHANDLTYSSTASGFNHFIDFLNFEASYPDLIHAFGLNQQAMQTWYTYNEPGERRIETFDGLDYIASYGDLIDAFRSGGSMRAVQDLGATHFIANGLAEGRTTTFNGLDYIASYSDLIAAFGANNDAGAFHYIEYGRSEARTTTFDGLDYIASYHDLIGAFGANEQAGAAHFITYGSSEGRSTTAFDGLSYIAQYTDLMNAFGANNDAGASHYITNGFSEGRSTSFDVAGYEAAHSDLQGRFATNDQFLTAYINTYVTTGHFLT
ncbi:MAG: hypothetical protein QOG66_2949 [Methylobacteriaceae bacterium]|jgi:hypothetical protein|nr:hypothetical protein [Methylobacteriaceae bacterium]